MIRNDSTNLDGEIMEGNGCMFDLKKVFFKEKPLPLTVSIVLHKVQEIERNVFTD